LTHRNYTFPFVLKLSIGLLLLLSSFNTATAQRFPFTTINVKDGLPQSSVFKIVQDPQGYIWMATEAGLCRYDGYKFITYSIYNGLGSKFVSDVKFDLEGRLWVSTMGKGVSMFDGKTFHRFDESNGLPSNQVRSLEFSNTGELFVCTLDTGVIKLTKNKKPEVLFKKDGTIFRSTWKLNKLKNGDLLVACRDGAIRFLKEKNYEYEIICPASQTLLNTFEAKNGDIYIGGVNQLSQVRGKQVIDLTPLLSSLDGKPTNVWDIFEPRDGSGIYVSTSKGILIIKDSKTKWLTTENGLPYDQTMDTYQDRYGNFWVGSYGGGAAILDSKGIDHFDYSEHILPLSSASLCDDQQGRIWIGTDYAGMFSYDGTVVKKETDPAFNGEGLILGLALNPVSKELLMGCLNGDLAKIKNGKISWVRKSPGGAISILHISFLKDGTAILSTQTGAFTLGLNDQDPVRIQEVPDEYIRSSFVDLQGYVWFLGDEGQLLRWKDHKIKDFTSLINPDVSGLEQGLYDARHKLYWFCSNTGLIVWDGKGIHKFHSGNGLKSDSPWSITQDSTGNIWVGHEKGVECIDVDNKKITFIGYDQGFTPVETNSCVAMTDSKGDVWFGTISSATRVRIHDMKDDDRTGILRVQKVWVGKNLRYDELYGDTACPELILNYNENTINIEMAALCYSNSRDVKYSWFLKNYDEEWIIDNEHREALYTNLPPGYYEFHAKAIEPNAFQTNEIVIKITIRRPFWHRPWFYIIEFTILGLFIFLSFRFSSNPNQNRLGSFVTLLTILIIFESLLLYLSTYINKFTGDVPVFQLVMNVVLAATLNPLEHFIQRVMRKWALKNSRRRTADGKQKKENP
jgi:ligand-binding sensor domain-containing protein